MTWANSSVGVEPLVAICPLVCQTAGDCGIVALAVLTHKSYFEVASATLAFAPTVHEKGLWTQELIRLAKRLGVGLRHVTLDVLREQSAGIIVVALPRRRQHFVVWFNGCIIPGDGLVWEELAYYDAHHAKAKSALALLGS